MEQLKWDGITILHDSFNAESIYKLSLKSIGIGPKEDIDEKARYIEIEEVKSRSIELIKNKIISNALWGYTEATLFIQDIPKDLSFRETADIIGHIINLFLFEKGFDIYAEPYKNDDGEDEIYVRVSWDMEHKLFPSCNKHPLLY